MEEFKVNQGSYLSRLLIATVRERLTGEISLEPPLNVMFAHRNPRRFRRHTVQGVGEGNLKEAEVWLGKERIAANKTEQSESEVSLQR